jgi:type I restriction enzyme S subunit
MSSKFSKYKLGEIINFSYGKMPKQEYLNTGKYPTFSGYKYQYLYPEMNCKKGDVIVVARGVGGTGDVKIVQKDCYLTNLAIKFDLNNEIIDNKYCFYHYFLSTLRHLDSGSAQSQITINDLSNLEIIIPPLQTQKKIAHILSTLA